MLLLLNHVFNRGGNMKQFITFRWILAGIIASTLLLGVSAAAAKQMTATIEQPLPPVKKVQEKPTLQPETPVAGTTTQTNIKSIAAAKKSASIPSPVPNCSPATNIRAPRNSSSALKPGYHEQNLVEEYKVYGNSVEEINNQMFACGPVINGEHYGASADYWLSWTYNLTFDNTGFCTVTDTSVSLTNFQVLPAWQNSNNALSGRWNGFITNLRNHENGHSAFSRSGAQNLYNKLQTLKSTDCSDVSMQANQLASDTFAAIEAANISYDNDNHHGATEGASL